MKKFIPLFLLLIAFIGIFIYSVNYRNSRMNENVSQSVTNEHKQTDSALSKADIIAYNEEGGYRLYYKNNIATITYKEAKLEFSNWGGSIEFQTPQLYYNDFDGDGEKELIIRLVDDYSSITGQTVYSYSLYLIKPVDVDGETRLSYVAAQSSNWKNVFGSAINFEVTQLKECRKFLQFAMNDADSPIHYDEKTGITDNKYVSYAKADCSSKKEYYNVSKYNRGLGIYNVLDDGTITLDIQIIINYEESELSYHIGNIHCEMRLKEGEFDIKPNTISFIPLDSYKITNPQDVAAENWTYYISNNSSADSENTVIDNINAAFSINSYSTNNSLNFGNMVGGIKNVDEIIFTQSNVTLKAKSGYLFDSAQVQEGRYEVFIGNDNQDISYTASVNGDELIINFDKTYDKEDFSTVKINFGL